MLFHMGNPMKRLFPGRYKIPIESYSKDLISLTPILCINSFKCVQWQPLSMLKHLQNSDEVDSAVDPVEKAKTREDITL